MRLQEVPSYLHLEKGSCLGKDAWSQKEQLTCPMCTGLPQLHNYWPKHTLLCLGTKSQSISTTQLSPGLPDLGLLPTQNAESSGPSAAQKKRINQQALGGGSIFGMSASLTAKKQPRAICTRLVPDIRKRN